MEIEPCKMRTTNAMFHYCWFAWWFCLLDFYFEHFFSQHTLERFVRSQWKCISISLRFRTFHLKLISICNYSILAFEISEINVENRQYRDFFRCIIITSNTHSSSIFCFVFFYIFRLTSAIIEPQNARKRAKSMLYDARLSWNLNCKSGNNINGILFGFVMTFSWNRKREQ